MLCIPPIGLGMGALDSSDDKYRSDTLHWGHGWGKAAPKPVSGVVVVVESITHQERLLSPEYKRKPLKCEIDDFLAFGEKMLLLPPHPCLRWD